MLYFTALVVAFVLVPSHGALKFQEGNRQPSNRGVDVMGSQQVPGIRRITPIPPSAFCKTEANVNSSYFDRCNWCRCIDVGEAMCTLMACPIEPAVLPRIRPIPASVMCGQENVGKSYYDGCNGCRCMHVRGKPVAGCTRRACPMVRPFDDIELSTTEATCVNDTNGTVFYKTECRICICTAKNASWCYNQERPGCRQPMVTFASKHREGTMRRVMSPSGRARQRSLPAKPKREPPTAIPRLTAETACLTTADSGKTFFDGCNWCECIGVGEALCTWKQCV